ncbi:MAG: LysM peptidoglycan-binding domain-containing protein [Thermoanaerobacteraceae bacterium]|nr:LysM peptidoglycan-binding domain-containing protein [Thermoanaerobacteraceae bacterium]
MDFYLTAPDGNRIHLPVNPEKITAQTGSKMQTFEVINLGDIELPRGITPARISWEGFFPGQARENAVFVKSWQDPKVLVRLISLWRRNNTKVRLLVTETPLNLDCYIEAFEHTWSGGYGDCQYRIELVEARELVILTDVEKQKRTIVGGQKSVPKRPAPPPPKTYTVKPGDTLWVIAKKTLGDGSRWRDIYNANVSVIGKDPNVLKPGQVLRIA